VAEAAAEDLAAQRAPEAEGAPRLLIEKLQLVSADGSVSTEVTLARGPVAFTGAAAAHATSGGIHRAVAEATLAAVEGALGEVARFQLERLEATTLGGGADRAMLVEVSMITRGGSERLLGVSAVRDDARQAVIRATLAALNRRIATYLLEA
jgi:hypothetical protein